MALGNYTELKAAVADWAGRTDLTTPIDYDFLIICEAEMRRRIRRTTKTSTIYVSAAEIDPPSDMAEPIALILETGNAYNDVPLKIVTPQKLAEVKAMYGGVSGIPTHVAYYNSKFQFAPEPNQSYDCTVIYAMQFTALSGSNTTNAILTDAPDIYLFGCMWALTLYLEHDERTPVFKARFDAAIDQYNEVRQREEYGAGLTEVRLPFTIG